MWALTRRRHGNLNLRLSNFSNCRKWVPIVWTSLHLQSSVKMGSNGLRNLSGLSHSIFSSSQSSAYDWEWYSDSPKLYHLYLMGLSILTFKFNMWSSWELRDKSPWLEFAGVCMVCSLKFHIYHPSVKNHLSEPSTPRAEWYTSCWREGQWIKWRNDGWVRVFVS